MYGYTGIVSMVLEFQCEPSNRFRIDSLVQNLIARSRISNSTMHGSHLGNLALPCRRPTTTEPRRSCWGPLWHAHTWLSFASGPTGPWFKKLLLTPGAHNAISYNPYSSIRVRFSISAIIKSSFRLYQWAASIVSLMILIKHTLRGAK